MRDLLVTMYTPALGTGQTLRTYGIARALAANGDGLDLLYVRVGAEAPDGAFMSIPGIDLHETTPSRGARRVLAYATARCKGVPVGFARGVSPELLADASRLAEAPHRGRVIADGPIAAAALMALARRRPVIYNAHNLESHFRRDLLSRRTMATMWERRALARFERMALARASESWMVSKTDMAGALELCPTAKLRHVPNVVDVAAITPVSPLSREPRAALVAGFYYEPNRNGLRFLVEEVFPRVWAQMPDARLQVVGAGLQQPPSQDPRVEAPGYVEDLSAVYARARCAVVPLLQGGGSPLKLIEALAYGVPVLATRRAVAGLEVRDGEHVLLADDADSFAAALVRLLGEDASEMGRRGRELVAERYSIEALTHLLRLR
jgi:glycosyltransferase involved in cell wall biosynthesis